MRRRFPRAILGPYAIARARALLLCFRKSRLNDNRAMIILSVSSLREVHSCGGLQPRAHPARFRSAASCSIRSPCVMSAHASGGSLLNASYCEIRLVKFGLSGASIRCLMSRVVSYEAIVFSKCTLEKRNLGSRSSEALDVNKLHTKEYLEIIFFASS